MVPDTYFPLIAKTLSIGSQSKCDFVIVANFGSSAESVGANLLKTEFASANNGIFERKH